MKRVALIAPFMTHYRVGFYDKLSKKFDGELLFFFQNKTTDDGRPGQKVNEIGRFHTYSNNKISLGRLKLAFSFNLVRKIRRERIDVIIIEGASSNLTSWYFIIFKRLLGLKVIAWACGWQPEIKSQLWRNIKKLIERSFFNHVDYILTYSSKAAGYFSTLGIKTTMQVAYNGIDTDVYLTSRSEILSAAKTLNPSYSQKIFLYVGGFFKEKGVDMLIDSFQVIHSENKNTSLWLIGSGPKLNELQAQVYEQKIENVVFWGRIESGVDVYFAAADYVVLPGIGGLALNQAMLWGTPCIVSEADGTEEDLVFEGITGFRFEKNNSQSLIEAMKRALSIREDEYGIMAEKAQEKILARSNTDQMVITFINALSELL